MKKNVLKVLSLILVAGMLFSFASCASEIQIRLVDSNGNDIDLSALAGALQANGTSTNSGSSGSNSSNNTSTTPPANNSGTSTTPPANSGEQTSEPENSGSTTPSTGMPATTEEVVNFYKAAVERIKNNGEAGYIKKEWQNVDSVNIGGSTVNNLVTGVLGNFMTKEEDAGEQNSEKGSDDAKDRFPGFTLTDYSYVASATCSDAGNGNYKVVIIMKDEDTPKKEGSILGQVTNSLLYWEDIDNTLKNDSTVNKILTSYNNIQVIYKGYNITAEITPDGKFVTLDHTADVDILIGEAKITVFTIKDKSGHMWNYCKYYNFAY